MSLPISSIADVTITRTPAPISQAAFGIPLLLDEHDKFSERTKDIFQPSDLLALGFETTDVLYEKVLALFAQDTKVEKAVIGRKDAGETITAALDAIQDYNGGWYALVTTFTTDEDILEVAGWTESSPNEKYYSFQSDSVDSQAGSIGIDFVLTGSPPGSLIPAVCDVSDWVRNPVNFGYDSNSEIINSPDSLCFRGTDSTHQYFVVNNDSDIWYVYQFDLSTTVGVGSSPTDQLNLQLTVGGNQIYDGKKAPTSGSNFTGYDCNVTVVPEVSNVFSSLKALNYDRSLPNFALEGHLDAGIVGLMSPIVPGAATAKFKTVKGVPVSALTRQQYAALDALNCNYFTNVTGTDLYAEGTVSSGEFLDVIIGIDWIKYTVSFNVFSVLARAPKIPYTDKGASIIQSEVSAVLNQAIERGILREDPAPVVTVPAVADVAASDRQARHLPDVRFTGELAGAIHKTTINGSVSV